MTPKKREAIRQMFGGKCAYCGCELNGKWHVDHVEALQRRYKWRRSEWVGDRFIEGRFVPTGECDSPENEREDNLFPACVPCNINKSSSPLEVWRKHLMDGPEALAGYNGRFRHMLRLGVVKVNPAPLVFWFEKYNPDKHNYE